MSGNQWNNVLRYLQFAGYAMLIASLPLSNFFMSFSSFWLVGVLILEVLTDVFRKKKWQHRFSGFISNKPAILLSLIYLLPLIGLLWTTDFKYAQWDLRMKLPILFMPFLLTSLNPITSREYRALLGIFILSLSVAVTTCLLIYWGIYDKPFSDVREISIFISHVRFSLLLLLGLCVLFYEAWNKPMGKALCVMLSILYVYFLYILASVTGIVVMTVLILWAITILIKRTKKTTLKYAGVIALVAIPFVAIVYVKSCYNDYFSVPEIVWSQLEETTTEGEVYDHNPQYRSVEDGHYVMTHIAWGELYSAWNKKSKIYPDSLDARGHILKGTLIRYLASKGLKKDNEGISALSNEDVLAIENGVTSVNDDKKSGLRKRLDKIFFELANYRAGGSPSGHSVFQRFEFWNTAIMIIEEHPWIGVGTGDVKTAFAEMYVKKNSPLDTEHRLRAHNQYLTMWLTYGVVGFLALVAVIMLPLFFGSRRNMLFLTFLIIASMSFITEDTLESQAGVMFFTFFYIFFTLKKKVAPHELRPVK